MRTASCAGLGRLLLAVVFSSPAAGFAQEEPAQPEDWRDLAKQSDVVATVTVTAPRIRVIRPEKRVYRTVQAADGRQMTMSPLMTEYVEGVLVRVRVEELYKSDAHAAGGGQLEVFFQWHAAPFFDEGERLLLFLQNPIPLDALGIEKYGTWAGIKGTTLEYPGDIDRKGEEFNVARAYGITFPEIWRGARPFLSYSTEPEETIALAIREAKAAAVRIPPYVTLTAPRERYFRGTVALAGEVSDDVDIGSARVTADGQELAAFTASPFTATWDSTSVGDGTHILKATVLDRAGHRVESPALELIVDNERPSLTVAAVPSEVAAEATKMIPVQVTVTWRDNRDPAPMFKLVSITAEGPVLDGDVAGAELGTHDREFELRARPNPPGQASRVYTITYEARDAAGNTRRATTRVTVAGGAGLE